MSERTEVMKWLWEEAQGYQGTRKGDLFLQAHNLIRDQVSHAVDQGNDAHKQLAERDAVIEVLRAEAEAWLAEIERRREASKNQRETIDRQHGRIAQLENEVARPAKVWEVMEGALSHGIYACESPAVAESMRINNNTCVIQRRVR